WSLNGPESAVAEADVQSCFVILASTFTSHGSYRPSFRTDPLVRPFQVLGDIFFCERKAKFFSLRVKGRLGHDEAISGVANFTPGQLWQWMTRKERSLHGRKLDADANCRTPARERTRYQKLVIAEAPVGGLDNVLGGPELFFRIGIDASIGPRQIPNASALPIECFLPLSRARIGNENFCALIRKRVVQLAA